MRAVKKNIVCVRIKIITKIVTRDLSFVSKWVF